jgi:hypothetical protein
MLLEVTRFHHAQSRAIRARRAFLRRRLETPPTARKSSIERRPRRQARNARKSKVPPAAGRFGRAVQTAGPPLRIVVTPTVAAGCPGR